jgi:two-component SAPR family response regulator
MLRAELFSQQNYGSTAGGAFIQKVRSNNPECRIILYGGNTHRDQTARELKVWGTVQKPISDDILRKLCILGSLTKDEQHKIENGMHVPVKLESGYLDHIKITREFE